MDGLDTKYLEENGYGIGNVVTHDYFVVNFLSFRNITKVPFFGWSGVMDMDPMEMMNRAMLVQNRSIISKAKFYVREKGAVSIREAAVELMRPFYPYGQCLQIVPHKKNDDDQNVTLILALDS